MPRPAALPPAAFGARILGAAPSIASELTVLERTRRPIGSSERPGLRWLHALSDVDEFGYVVAVVAAYAVSWW